MKIESEVGVIHGTKMPNLQMSVVDGKTLETLSVVENPRYDRYEGYGEVAEKLIKSGKGCRLSGSIQVPRVHGKLLLMSDIATGALGTILNKGGDSMRAFERLNFDHIIKALSFGDPDL